MLLFFSSGVSFEEILGFLFAEIRGKQMLLFVLLLCGWVFQFCGTLLVFLKSNTSQIEKGLFALCRYTPLRSMQDSQENCHLYIREFVKPAFAFFFFLLAECFGRGGENKEGFCMFF